MDPVLLPTLLDVVDLLAEKQAPLSLEALNVKRSITPKRFAEIGRVLESMRIASRIELSLVPGQSLTEFVTCWENKDLDGVNELLRRYEPYDKFLGFLKSEKSIKVPPRKDSAARKMSGQYIRDKSALTFVAVDTFKWWGMAVAQVYISHIGTGDIYWGGAQPSLEEFEAAAQSHYREIRPSDSYANVGRLADRVCQDLNIAFIRFEKLFEQLCRERPCKYLLSTSLSRLKTTKSPVQTLLPRSMAKQRAESSRKPLEWTEKRFIEDGVMIGKHNVKMLRINKDAK